MRKKNAREKLDWCKRLVSVK